LHSVLYLIQLMLCEVVALIFGNSPKDNILSFEFPQYIIGHSFALQEQQVI